jgi:hypothetical protein
VKETFVKGSVIAEIHLCERKVHKRGSLIAEITEEKEKAP